MFFSSSFVSLFFACGVLLCARDHISCFDEAVTTATMAAAAAAPTTPNLKMLHTRTLMCVVCVNLFSCDDMSEHICACVHVCKYSYSCECASKNDFSGNIRIYIIFFHFPS